jgi:two-component system, HptB-dependent secretion and biofilm response regulator
MPVNSPQAVAQRFSAQAGTHGDNFSSEPGIETMALTLLLVEDDFLSRSMLLMRVDTLFKEVLVAADGAEGFRLFCEHQPDIVLTDQVMPVASGLDLLHLIRGTGAKTPVILMTSLDEKVLLEAINCGVERFIPKPFDFNLLFRTLNSVAREVANERSLEQHRDQEVELLRYRDAYNSMQQESARRKERHVVRHDLRHQALKGAGGVRWAIMVAYAPHDIMCGDGYSVRHLFDGRQLIFMVDAMGSGMSASLTAMLTTSFFNYQVENVHLWEKFTLQIFLKRFQEYLCSILLEDEVLSCGFFLLDLVREEVETAVFALPPLLLRGIDGSVRKVCGQNPPLGIYPCQIRTSTLSLANQAGFLVLTDGVSDAQLKEGGAYREVLESDYRASPTLKALQRRFQKRTVPEDLDDLTLLHLRRLDFDFDWTWEGKPALTLAGLSLATRQLLGALSAHLPLDPTDHDEIEVILTEALINALEHGCLGIDRQEKAKLLLSGHYEDALAQMTLPPGAAITLGATLWRGAAQPLLLIEVQDSGPGLPGNDLRAPAARAALNGRGLRLIANYSDALFTDGPGGHLIILKTLGEGDRHAD